METLLETHVELVEHSPGAWFSGIGRYTRHLYDHLVPHVSARLATHIDPPFARRVPFLHNLPIGVQAHQEGSIVHFMEDMGCSEMLWRPVRPAVATSHDLGWLVWRPEAGMHRAVDRLMLYLSYLGLKRMDAIIAVSEFSRRMLIQRLRIPAEQVITIYSGIDTALFRPVAGARAQLAARYGLPDGPEDKYLMYVGTEIPRKNLVTLLRALKRLPPHIRLLKVGGPGMPRFRERTIKAIAELGLEGRVIFVGQVSDADLALFYGAADVYVCCSFLEGFGHPVLEAMACGTPVICSDAGSLPEIVGDAASPIPPMDTEAFAEAVLAAVSDSGRRQQMIERGLKRAGSFSWNRTVQRVVEVYRLVSANARVGNPCTSSLGHR